MTDHLSPVVAQIRTTIEARLRELEPVLIEARQLETIRSALLRASDAQQLSDISDQVAQARAREPTAETGRRRGTDGRAPQGENKRRILEAIAAQPGVAAPELADQLGIKRTVVSATVTRLKQSGDLEACRGGVRVPASPHRSDLAPDRPESRPLR